MGNAEPRVWHDAALRSGPQADDSLVSLGRTPIADECQHCEVCRWAKEYVDRRLRERAGETLAPADDAAAAWRQLRGALDSARDAMHGRT